MSGCKFPRNHNHPCGVPIRSVPEFDGFLTFLEEEALIHVISRVIRDGRHLASSCPYPTRGMCPHSRTLRILGERGFSIPTSITIDA